MYRSAWAGDPHVAATSAATTTRNPLVFMVGSVQLELGRGHRAGTEIRAGHGRVRGVAVLLDGADDAGARAVEQRVDQVELGVGRVDAAIDLVRDARDRRPEII